MLSSPSVPMRCRQQRGAAAAEGEKEDRKGRFNVLQRVRQCYRRR